MMSFEAVLFNYNEGMHRVGLLADDKYITQETFLFSAIATVILMHFAMRFIEPMLNNKHFVLTMAATPILIIYMIDGIIPILVMMIAAMILFGFVTIIYKYPQYGAIREFIDRIF